MTKKTPEKKHARGPCVACGIAFGDVGADGRRDYAAVVECDGCARPIHEERAKCRKLVGTRDAWNRVTIRRLCAKCSTGNGGK